MTTTQSSRAIQILVISAAAIFATADYVCASTLNILPLSETTACQQPLDEETLDGLRLPLGSFSEIHELQPGESVDLFVGLIECCYFVAPVPACMTWSIEPSSAGTIDAQAGILTVSEDTENGTVLTVTANIEDGRRILTEDILVYTPEQNPLVGVWSETRRLSCADRSETIPKEFIGELLFNANGSFSVTWSPFEIYVDYLGTYAFDLETGVLELTIETDSSYIPENVDLKGQANIDENGRLLMEDMWLGEPAYAQVSPSCGHVFQN